MGIRYLYISSSAFCVTKRSAQLTLVSFVASESSSVRRRSLRSACERGVRRSTWALQPEQKAPYLTFLNLHLHLAPAVLETRSVRSQGLLARPHLGKQDARTGTYAEESCEASDSALKVTAGRASTFQWWCKSVRRLTRRRRYRLLL